MLCFILKEGAYIELGLTQDSEELRITVNLITDNQVMLYTQPYSNGAVLSLSVHIALQHLEVLSQFFWSAQETQTFSLNLSGTRE